MKEATQLTPNISNESYIEENINTQNRLLVLIHEMSIRSMAIDMKRTVHQKKKKDMKRTENQRDTPLHMYFTFY